MAAEIPSSFSKVSKTHMETNPYLWNITIGKDYHIVKLFMQSSSNTSDFMKHSSY